MSKILHYLNGDATRLIFEQTDIEGDVAVMRETFCMGPLSNKFDESFWNGRRDWYKKNYFVSNEGYNRRVIAEFEKVSVGYDEIIIWYEYDVFCQVNMLGYFNWMMNNTESVVSLVYSPQGLGTLSPEDYPSLVASRLAPSVSLAEDCKSIWHSLTVKDSDQLELISKRPLAGLPNMSNALRCYKAQNMGNPAIHPVDLRIKSIIQSGITNGKRIVEQLLKSDNIFGYGDLQYMIVLTSMADEIDFDTIEAKDIDGFVEAVFEREFRLR